MAKILVADDERAICEAFSLLLKTEGHTPLIASTGRSALDVFRRDRPQAVFLDVQMPDMSGIDVLQQIHLDEPDLPVIIMTAHGSVQTAMRAMQLGAFDYLGKPLELPQIRAQLKRMLHQPRGEPEASTAASFDVADQRIHIIGSSSPMQDLFKMMGLLTDNDLTVLITGESGVGKDLVAQAIHHHGPRHELPFVAINCAAIPENLLESELFGHEKGAFTDAHTRRIGKFEAAMAGTLFLDEISELPQHLQAKLLRVLQDHRFERVGGSESIPLRARIIAATNRQHQPDSAQRPLRSDFYYRLSLVNLHIPPLRERRGDIPELARHFLRMANASLGRTLQSIEPQAMARLLEHPWPGNVRELENTVKRSALIARGDILTEQDLQFDPVPFLEPHPQGTVRQHLDQTVRTAMAELLEETPRVTAPYRTIVEQVEQTLIDEALRRCDGNQVAASSLLGINRTTLRKKHQG
ncbi:MAG: sigma-54 dependent transcriptional regulator [Pseudomonadales bacterium]|nr:sigma-54-dependent Fis family transcriptional regulator [Pseudomonadales bacterium]